MFGRKRNNPPEAAGNLIYADPRSTEAPPAPKPDRSRLLRALVIMMGIGLVIAVTAAALGFRYRQRQDRYEYAQSLLETKAYDAAQAEFEALGRFRDSAAAAEALRRQAEAYRTAADLVTQQRYDEAIAAFRALGDYADSATQAAYQVTYQKALDLITEIDVGRTQLLTRILADHVRLTDENSYPTTLGYEVAAALLESLGDYRSAPALMDRCYYSAGLVKLGWNDWAGALAYMEKMKPETAAEFHQEYLQHYNRYAEQEGR